MEEKLKEKYIFYGEIGRGGSGKVFKAYDRHLQCLVAVKRFPMEDAISDRELGMLKELRHPAFPVVTDYMEESGYKYLVMEYIEGKNLADYIREMGAVGQGQAVKWALELAEVLIYLHERECPVVYRDMKPANIIIDGEGHVRLVDFGTAFLRYQEAHAACAGGTWGYAAPEQFEGDCGKAVDERSDIYGLGATLFHMLTGCDPSRPPFLMQPIRSYDRRLSAELEKVVRKATQQEKEKRYPTVRRMKQELEGYGKADRMKGYAENIGKAVYGLALAGCSFCFLRMWAWMEEEAAGWHRSGMAGQMAAAGENAAAAGNRAASVEHSLAVMGRNAAVMGKDAAEKRLIISAACILLLCLGKWLVSRWRLKGYRGVRQEKNVLLTMKKGKGLVMVLFLGILAAGAAGGGSVWAKNGAESTEIFAEGPETGTRSSLNTGIDENPKENPGMEKGREAKDSSGMENREEAGNKPDAWSAENEENILFVVVRNKQGQKLLIRYDAEYALSDTLKLELPLRNFEDGEHYELRLECTNRETGEAQSRIFYLKGAGH